MDLYSSPDTQENEICLFSKAADSQRTFRHPAENGIPAEKERYDIAKPLIRKEK